MAPRSSRYLRARSGGNEGSPWPAGTSRASSVSNEEGLRRMKAMTLLNAPEFDEKKEAQKHTILVGLGILVAAMVVLTVTGFLMGHGWLFMNLPVEHKVGIFLSTLQDRKSVV